MSWLTISFLLVSIVIYWTFVFKAKKNLLPRELYVTVLFALFLDLLVDTYASFRYKAWGFFNIDDIEYTSLLVILGIYPAVAILIVNWYPYRDIWWLRCTYLLAWSVYSTFYEWLTMQVGIIWHLNWRLSYSFLLYPFIFYVLVLHIKLYRRVFRA
jgi:hypothetical protein